MKVELLTDEDQQTPEMREMGKVARLATNAAKKEIIEWAERFDGEVDKLSLAIVASIQIAADTVEAAIKLDDHGFAIATLHQTEQVLLPLLEQLRAKLAVKH